jgi:hypothetical protein
MRCMVCGATMTLIKVVPDDAMAVHGFEHHTFMCSACRDVEQRLVFIKHGREGDAEAMPVHTAPPIVPASAVQDERISAQAPGLLRRVVAKILGRQGTFSTRATQHARN